jgi:toxin ParE1/3/4
MGTPIRELESLGWLQFRQVLWRQVRVIYELRGDAVVVYMLLHSRRDFQTHLQRRLLG